MNAKTNPLVNLLDQVKQGQQPAEAKLWQAMSPQIEKMVRHVVRFGPGRSVLEQKIVREVAQVVDQDEDKVVSVVTQRLFQDMYGRLQGGHGRLDTQHSPALRDAPTRRERVGALAVA